MIYRGRDSTVGKTSSPVAIDAIVQAISLQDHVQKEGGKKKKSTVVHVHVEITWYPEHCPMNPFPQVPRKEVDQIDRCFVQTYRGRRCIVLVMATKHSHKS